jgi:PmbA protein
VSEVLGAQEALERILSAAKAAGAQACDAVFEESESLSVEVFEGAVKNLERSDSAGIGLRVLVEGRPGYSFTERLTAEAIDRCAADAVGLSKFTDPLEIVLPGATNLVGGDLGLVPSEAREWTPEGMIEACLQAETAAREADARIHNIPHLGGTRSRGRVLLANSQGFRGRRESTSVSFGVGVVAREAGIDKMGWDGISWRDASKFDPRSMAREAVSRATSLLGAAPVPAGRIPVLFDERVAGQFLGIFLGAFLADSVQKGQSRLVGRIGEKIAVDGFDLSTQPHLHGMAGSKWFDGEGVPTRPRSLVEGGVLKGFLHNLETSRRDGLEPTGDASRSYTGRVSAGFANLQVGNKGGRPIESLRTSHARVLHVVKLEGSTGCNPVSGDISIGVQGFLVENGTSVPVDRVSLSGNFFELLQSLEACGDRYRPGVHGSFVPALLFAEMNLAS